MGKYGLAAVAATNLIAEGSVSDVCKAWERAVSQQFPGRVPAQRKGCPRAAYLGLCAEGFVRGIERGNYTRSVLNKRYAVDAVKLLRSDPSLAKNTQTLWRRVVNGASKVENSQIDVVIALWERGLISAA